MIRYLDVQAPGVLEWLGRQPDSPAQKVFAGLLRLPHSAPLLPARLAEQFGLDLPDFSRALFELNRHQSLRVTEHPSTYRSDFHYDFPLLCEDLRCLATGKPQIMLATPDGLCLAHQGLAEHDCMRWAARCHEGPDAEIPHVVPLYFGSTLLRLCSSTTINMTSPALLRLARRLISLAMCSDA